MAGETVAVLVAAGSSRRMGGVDKLWAELGGRPLLAWPLEMLAGLDEVDVVVVVAPAERHREVAALASGIGGVAQVRCVAGGARRRESVAAGLAAAPEAAWYVVHDAARPLASAELARRVLAAARERGDHGAAVPGLAVADTVKAVEADGRVRETLERASLRAVQTPQAFAGALLRRAHAELGAEERGTEGAGALSPEQALDDAQLVERLGEAVWVVEGEPGALKVTTAEDLERVRVLAAGRAG